MEKNNEQMAKTIGKLLFKHNGKYASANYNHVRKLSQQIAYNDNKVKDKEDN